MYVAIVFFPDTRPGRSLTPAWYTLCFTATLGQLYQSRGDTWLVTSRRQRD